MSECQAGDGGCADATEAAGQADHEQYHPDIVKCYERIFGVDFIASTGQQTVEKIAKHLQLTNGDRVLDIGCGIGGPAFYLAKNHDVQVDGVDCGKALIQMANERKPTDLKVSFETGDIEAMDFPPGLYDAIFNIQLMVHIADKKALYRKCLEWMAPGGRLVIVDWCLPESEPTENMTNYMKFYNYNACKVSDYVKDLEEVGFVNVLGENEAERFLEIWPIELKRTGDLLRELEQDGKTDLAAEVSIIKRRMEGRGERLKTGQQAAAFITAQKPK